MSTAEEIAGGCHPVAGASPLRAAGRALTRGRGLAGVVLVGLVVLAGAFAPVLAPYDPLEQIPGANLAGPGARHWLGTDEVNRDLLSRTLHGIRVDLLIIFVAVPVGALLGTLLGLSGAVWSRLDVLVQRTFDLIFAFPAIVLAIALAMVVGPGVLTVSAVIVLAEIPIFGRLVRTSALSVRERPYVEAARVVGAGRWWVLGKHILPNSLEPLTVQLALSMSVAVFIEGAMSFLGLGVTPPTPSLGSLVEEGAAHVHTAPLFAIGPLMVVVVLVLGLLLVAQAMAHGSRRR